MYPKRSELINHLSINQWALSGSGCGTAPRRAGLIAGTCQSANAHLQVHHELQTNTKHEPCQSQPCKGNSSKSRSRLWRHRCWWDVEFGFSGWMCAPSTSSLCCFIRNVWIVPPAGQQLFLSSSWTSVPQISVQHATSVKVKKKKGLPGSLCGSQTWWGELTCEFRNRRWLGCQSDVYVKQAVVRDPERKLAKVCVPKVSVYRVCVCVGGGDPELYQRHVRTRTRFEMKGHSLCFDDFSIDDRVCVSVHVCVCVCFWCPRFPVPLPTPCPRPSGPPHPSWWR